MNSETEAIKGAFTAAQEKALGKRFTTYASLQQQLSDINGDIRSCLKGVDDDGLDRAAFVAVYRRSKKGRQQMTLFDRRVSDYENMLRSKDKLPESDDDKKTPDSLKAAEAALKKPMAKPAKISKRRGVVVPIKIRSTGKSEAAQTGDLLPPEPKKARGRPPKAAAPQIDGQSEEQHDTMNGRGADETPPKGRPGYRDAREHLTVAQLRQEQGMDDDGAPAPL